MSGEPWFQVGELAGPGRVVLDGPEGRHAATVRRLRVGEPLVLTDGRGSWAPGTVTAVGRAELTVEVALVRQRPMPQPRVVLVQALPKGERGDLAVELATEAGVDVVVPWQARNCVSRWTGDKAVRGAAKWQVTAREAAKQSRRPWVPEVRPLADLAAVIDLVGAAAGALVLHELGETPLGAVALATEGDLVLVVGPEGGIDPDELIALRGAGATAVRLGPQVLRTSTAAAVALGALGVLTTRWDRPDPA